MKLLLENWRQYLNESEQNAPSTQEAKKPGLWANIHAKRKRGE